MNTHKRSFIKNATLQKLVLKALSFFLLILTISSCEQESTVFDNTVFKNTDEIKSGFLDPYCTSIGRYFLTDQKKPQSKVQKTSREETFKKVISKKIDDLPRFVEVTLTSHKTLDLSPSKPLLSESIQHQKDIDKYNFHINKIPICNFSATSTLAPETEFSSVSTPFYLQNKLHLLKNSLSEDQWPSIQQTMNVVIKKLIETNKAILSLDAHEPAEIFHQERCVGLNTRGQTAPFWNISFRYQGKSYYTVANSFELLTDSCGFFLHPYSFGIDGTGTVYSIKNSDGTDESFETEQVDFKHLSKSEFLCNRKFVTQNARSSDNRDYDFSEGSQEFLEVTLFHNANVQADWFIANHPTMTSWRGPQILLEIGDPEKDPNEAVYIHNQLDDARQTIIIANGDGTKLDNMLIDPDVVSHEVGHHLVYLNIDRPGCEGRVLHEGLADYFALARKESPCMGTIICPTNSAICRKDQSGNSCLRHADNDYSISYEFPVEEGYFHDTSQVVSGLLWSLGLRIGHSQSAATALLALESMSSDGTFSQFINNLIEADKILNDSENSCWIEEEAVARSLVAGANACS